MRGERGKRLLRGRGESVERSFAHVYNTGGMRRTHLRGDSNILKRLWIHASAFNLGILMRQVFGVGAPRRLHGRRLDTGALEIALAILYAWLWMPAYALVRTWGSSRAYHAVIRRPRLLDGTRDLHHGLRRL